MTVTKVIRVGRGIALYVPSSEAQKLRLRPGQKVEVAVLRGKSFEPLFGLAPELPPAEEVEKDEW